MQIGLPAITYSGGEVLTIEYINVIIYAIPVIIFGVVLIGIYRNYKRRHK